MIRQQKGSTDTWAKELKVTDDDVAFLYDWLHAQGQPATTKQLGLALIGQRLAQQAKAIEREIGKAALYQPKNGYEPGQQLVFSALDFAVGTVQDIREGVNPTYPPFKVMRVRLEGEDSVREFAAELDYPHKLNADILTTIQGASPEEIYQEHKDNIEPALEARLRALSDLGFVNLNGQWFLRELMAEVHIGHLNIAEALIELNDRPMGTEDILPELDLPSEISKDIRKFSLETALRADERFINLGTALRPSWYLRRLVPPEVLETPARLIYEPAPFERAKIHPVLQQIEAEIDDEASDLADEPAEKRRPGDKATIILTYPHRRSGTLPLTPRTAGFFPTDGASIALVKLVDSRSGEAMNGWIVSDGRYVFGVGGWYEKNQIPAGAYVTLQRTSNPSEVIIEYNPRRMRREWVRIVDAEDGRLTFQMTKFPIACEYDEAMLIAEAEGGAVDELWAQEQERHRAVLDVVLDVFPELAKLNPRVHAKTLYAAFNVLKRCPPGPIFHALSASPLLEDVGNGYWTLDVTRIETR